MRIKILQRNGKLFGCGVVFVLVLSVLSSVMVPNERVFAALTESQMNFYAQNNLLFYDGSACNDTASGSMGSYDGSASKGLSSLQAEFVDKYHDIAEKLSVQYGIPWETVVAQGILESASGTSKFATERNNFFGIAAYDSNPNNAHSYSTPAEGWEGYYKNIVKTSTYRAHGVFSGDTITDPYKYAQAIKDAGYATDPNYVAKLSKLIQAIENRATEKGWQTSAQLAESHPEMLSNAAANAAGGEGDSASSVTSVDNCVSSGLGNGDINATAILLSWPDRTHSPDDPKPEYKEALAETGLNNYGESCVNVGKSCDAFLATVMRSSGADPDFPCCGAAKQLNYLQNSDLYEEIPNLGNTSNLQPGDIRASGSHVEIVVQLEDGTYRIASASHCDRTGDHGINYYADSSYKIFRKK